ncbi:MAG: CvpA family protein, partial [Planctomycetes bacterium]|nr:CvpA family protein [Planctomycetota bacterium]
LVFGFVVASRASTSLAQSDAFERVRAQLGQSGAEGVAYASIVGASLVVGLGVLLIFRRFFGSTLRLVDSLLGGVLGLAVGCLLFGLFALGVYHFEDSQLHRPIRESVIGSKIVDGVVVAARIFPQELRARIEAGIDESRTVSASDPAQSSPEPSPEKR